MMSCHPNDVMLQNVLSLNVSVDGNDVIRELFDVSLAEDGSDQTSVSVSLKSDAMVIQGGTVHIRGACSHYVSFFYSFVTFPCQPRTAAPIASQTIPMQSLS